MQLDKERNEVEMLLGLCASECREDLDVPFSSIVQSVRSSGAG